MKYFSSLALASEKIKLRFGLPEPIDDLEAFLDSNLPDIENTSLAFVFGDNGIGKTTMLKYYCSKLKNKGIPCTFYTCIEDIDLEKWKMDTFGITDTSTIITDVANSEASPVIIIDDFHELQKTAPDKARLFAGFLHIITENGGRVIFCSSQNQVAYDLRDYKGFRNEVIPLEVKPRTHEQLKNYLRKNKILSENYSNLTLDEYFHWFGDDLNLFKNFISSIKSKQDFETYRLKQTLDLMTELKCIKDQKALTEFLTDNEIRKQLLQLNSDKMIYLDEELYKKHSTAIKALVFKNFVIEDYMTGIKFKNKIAQNCVQTFSDLKSTNEPWYLSSRNYLFIIVPTVAVAALFGLKTRRAPQEV